MRVALFGHRDAGEAVLPLLEKTVRFLIEKEKADVFYVGTQGAFDRMAQGLLYRLCSEYAHIEAVAVLAYPPQAGKEGPLLAQTLLPAEAVVGPPRFAILRRNKWMLQNCDAVVCYVRHSFGGAAAMKRAALAAGKRVFEIGG